MIYALEGIDGSGKSSAIYELKHRIGTTFKGHRVIYTKEPRYSKVMLQEKDPLCQLYLFMYDHQRHLNDIIIPHAKDIIITDRYIFSRIAYFAAQFPKKDEWWWASSYAEEIHVKKGLLGGPTYFPDMNFLLLVDEPTLRSHLRSRYKGTDPSQDEINHLMHIQEVYSAIATLHSDTFEAIPVSSKKDTVDKIISYISKKIPEIGETTESRGIRDSPTTHPT